MSARALWLVSLEQSTLDHLCSTLVGLWLLFLTVFLEQIFYDGMLRHHED